MIPTGATARVKYRVLIVSLLGFPLLLFSLFGILGRATMEVDGVITSATTQCVSENYRCVTTYELASSRGQTTYRVPHNDHALRTDLRVGAHLLKRKWDLDYVVNGQEVSDFPMVLYSSIGIVGLLLMACGISRLPSIVRSYLRPQDRDAGNPDPHT